MGKAPCCDKNGIKKGPWTAEEDHKLIDYIQKYGHGRWRTLPNNAGLKRCGKSCRLRWTNYLRPDIKRGRFSLEEEQSIIHMHSVLGNKWSIIASRLPGRTDNEIKNYWNTHIKKKLLRMGIDPMTHKPRLDLLQLHSLLNSNQMDVSTLLGFGPMLNPNMLNQDQQNQNFTQIQPIHGTSTSAEFLNQTTQHSLSNYFNGQNMSNCGYYEADNSCENLSDLGLSSLMSAPSSSTTPLQSEDEKDSSCSNILMFDVSDGFGGVNGFL